MLKDLTRDEDVIVINILQKITPAMIMIYKLQEIKGKTETIVEDFNLFLTVQDK